MGGAGQPRTGSTVSLRGERACPTGMVSLKPCHPGPQGDLGRMGGHHFSFANPFLGDFIVTNWLSPTYTLTDCAIMTVLPVQAPTLPPAGPGSQRTLSRQTPLSREGDNESAAEAFAAPSALSHPCPQAPKPQETGTVWDSDRNSAHQVGMTRAIPPSPP